MLLCANDDFGLLHGLRAWRHYLTYKLIKESMNSTREICTVAHRVIIEYVAQLYNGILLLRVQGVCRGKVEISAATCFVGTKTLFHLQISMEIDEFKP